MYAYNNIFIFIIITFRTFAFVMLIILTTMQILFYSNFGWMFESYGISIFVGYLMPNIFYTSDQLYFKIFSLAYKNSFISNNSVYAV